MVIQVAAPDVVLVGSQGPDVPALDVAVDAYEVGPFVVANAHVVVDRVPAAPVPQPGPRVLNAVAVGIDQRAPVGLQVALEPTSKKR